MIKLETPFLPVGSPPAQHRPYYQQHSSEVMTKTRKGTCKLTYTECLFVVSRYLDRGILSLFYCDCSNILPIACLFHFPSIFSPSVLISWLQFPARPAVPLTTHKCCTTSIQITQCMDCRTGHVPYQMPALAPQSPHASTNLVRGGHYFFQLQCLTVFCCERSKCWVLFAEPLLVLQPVDANEHGQKKCFFFERIKILL